MSERAGSGPWARLLASAVVRDEGSSTAELGRALVRDGEVGEVEVALGTLAANVAGYEVSIVAKPVPPRIWAAMSRFARGNRSLYDAIEGRAQSVQLEHLMTLDWSEPLVPRPFELGRHCTCGSEYPCEHVAALAFAVADGIDTDPSLLLRWRGCVAGAVVPEEEETAPPPAPSIDLTDEDPWRAGVFPEAPPLRPLPVGAVLKRLGPSGLKLRGEELATVLQRAYDSFAASAPE
ncbi:MAG TPA: SWIM zinc finger family protein [Gaiellaceae bacterium]